jgi:hypothetical protein
MFIQKSERRHGRSCALPGIVQLVSELIWEDSQMLTKPLSIVLLAAVLFTASARADVLVYVVTDTQQFGTVDLNTGAFRQIGANTPEGQANLVPGANGLLLSLTFSGNLESINPTTGAVSVIGATGLGGSAFDLAEVGGILYATDLNNSLYTINSTTGAAHLIGPSGIPAVPLSDPNAVYDESLYGVGGKLYATFDTFDLPLSSPGIISSPALYQIDPSTGVATKVGSTMLGLSASVDVDNTLYAFHEGLANPTCVGPAPVPCRSDAQLFTLNLANGDTSFVTDVDPSATAIYGASPVPEPAPFALVGIGLTAIVFARVRRRWNLHG